MSQAPNIKFTGKRWRVARRIVQSALFLLFLAPVLYSGWSLLGLTVGGDAPLPTPYETIFYGTLSSSQTGPIDLLDPLATMQIILASRSFEVSWLIAALLVLGFFGILKARIYCGWVCPANFMLEGLDFVRTKLGIQVKERVLPRSTKIGVAGGILVLSFILSVPLFETFSPISFLNKIFVFGSLAGLLTVIGIVILELFWGHRVWCRALCPLGGLYQVVGRVGIFKVNIDKENCTHCDFCRKTCIADPEILDPILDGNDTRVYSGDCLLCGKCVDICPVRVLTIRPSIYVKEPQSSLPPQTQSAAEAVTDSSTKN